jgi:hypothetical protein
MRKVLIATFISLALASFAAPAFADDDSNSSNPPLGSTQPPQGHRPPRPGQDSDDQATQQRHHHLSQKYDDVTGVIIPPVAIKRDSFGESDVYQLPNVASNVDALLDNTNSVIPDSTSDALTGVNDPKSDYSLTKLGSKPTKATKTTINPNLSKPVQVKTLVLTKRTPTDEFMAGAMVMAGSLGVVAIGLLTLTSVHHFRLRRKA